MEDDVKLEIECTWNEKQNKAKQVIHFDYLPKSIFSMPDDKIAFAQKLFQTAGIEGPSALEELKALKDQFPKSLYANFVYLRSLIFFQYLEEAEEYIEKLTKRFPHQPLLLCSIASDLLNDKSYKKFVSLFNNIEVLKGAFPKRRKFFFEEALFFHNLWGRYWFETGNELQSEKHKKMISLVLNTMQTFQIAAHP